MMHALLGVICMRSLGGGAGSGFGEEILSILHAEAPKVLLLEALLWPASGPAGSLASRRAARLASHSASCLEPYNALLAASGIVDRGGAALLLDNAAIANVLYSALPSFRPFCADLNHLVAQALSSQSANSSPQY